MGAIVRDAAQEKLEHVRENAAALDFALSGEELREIDAAF